MASNSDFDVEYSQYPLVPFEQTESQDPTQEPLAIFSTQFVNNYSTGGREFQLSESCAMCRNDVAHEAIFGLDTPCNVRCWIRNEVALFDISNKIKPIEKKFTAPATGENNSIEVLIKYGRRLKLEQEGSDFTFSSQGAEHDYLRECADDIVKIITALSQSDSAVPCDETKGDFEFQLALKLTQKQKSGALGYILGQMFEAGQVSTQSLSDKSSTEIQEFVESKLKDPSLFQPFDDLVQEHHTLTQTIPALTRSGRKRNRAAITESQMETADTQENTQNTQSTPLSPNKALSEFTMHQDRLQTISNQVSTMAGKIEFKDLTQTRPKFMNPQELENLAKKLKIFEQSRALPMLPNLQMTRYINSRKIFSEMHATVNATLETLLGPVHEGGFLAEAADSKKYTVFAIQRPNSRQVKQPREYLVSVPTKFYNKELKLSTLGEPRKYLISKGKSEFYSFQPLALQTDGSWKSTARTAQGFSTQDGEHIDLNKHIGSFVSKMKKDKKPIDPLLELAAEIGAVGVRYTGEE